MSSIALVLGAGGIAGAAFHAGVLAALAETGWDARRAGLVVGTSAGSGVGAALRAGIDPLDLYRRAVGEPLSPHAAAAFERARRVGEPPSGAPPPGRWWGWPASPGLLARRALQPWTLRPGHAVAGVLPAGTLDTAAMRARTNALLAENGLEGRWPDQPLWIVAVRLADGARVVFGREPAPLTDVGGAVAASSAIPAWFAPVDIAGERYVDGGLHSPTNADLVVGLGFDAVVVSAPMASDDAGGHLGRRYHSLLLRREVAGLRRAGVPVLVLAPGADDRAVMGLDPMDPARAAAIARHVHDTAARRLTATGLPWS